LFIFEFIVELLELTAT